MSVRIRLQRHGRKRNPYYYIVVADSRSKRDGKFIERLGSYNPMTNPATIELDNEQAVDWLMKGAQPSDTVRAILSYKGVLLKKHLQVGVAKGALSQEEADNKFAEWLEQKAGKIEQKIEKLKSDASEEEKLRMEREAEVAAKRAKALKEAQQEAEGSAEAPADEAEESASADDSAESEEEKKEE